MVWFVTAQISWGTWALAGLVPGLIALIGVPLILYVLFPPEVRTAHTA
jgi:DASS family divalent anion:Na+ symporter